MNYGNLVIESQHQICHFARFVIHCAAYGTESLFSLVELLDLPFLTLCRSTEVRKYLF